MNNIREELYLIFDKWKDKCKVAYDPISGYLEIGNDNLFDELETYINKVREESLFDFIKFLGYRNCGLEGEYTVNMPVNTANTLVKAYLQSIKEQEKL